MRGNEKINRKYEQDDSLAEMIVIIAVSVVASAITALCAFKFLPWF